MNLNDGMKFIISGWRATETFRKKNKIQYSEYLPNHVQA